MECQYYQNKIENSDNKSKTVWSVINNIRGGSDAPKDIHMHGDGRLIASEFNNYFLKFASALTSELPTGYSSYLEQADTCIFLRPITESEIISIVKNLGNKHSSGDDEIPTSLIKLCINEIIAPLAFAIRSSFKMGIFPERLKLATIRPLHKKGSVTEFGNYRPISLLPSFSKIFERCMCDRLMEYFLQNDFFYEGQHAYLKGKGTNTALYEFLDAILQAMEKRDLAVGLFLDLSKAYDCVNHLNLLRKLKLYGVTGVAYNWMMSFLSGRKQQTVITKNGKKFKSERKLVTLGIPQGSILGPVLFLIYINDSHKAVAQLNCYLNCLLVNYADDKNFLITAENLQALLDYLNRTFNAISDWITNEGLVLNESKTNCVMFHTNRINPTNINMVKLNDSEISLSSETKLLGLIVDDVLSWESHIFKLNKKLSSVCYTLRVLSNYLNENGLKTVYFSNFESLVRYGLVFYGSAKSAATIFLSQKRAIRIIKRLGFRTSCRGHFKQMNVLTTSALYIEECLMFLAKNKEYFRMNLASHSYNVRDCHYMYPVHRLSLTEKGAKYSCMKLFNKLPSRIRRINNQRLFKKEIHGLLMELEPYTVQEFLDSTL